MTPRPDLVALPVDEKPNIIEQLWDSLAPAERDSVSAPEWRRDGLHRRQAFDEIRLGNQLGIEQAEVGQLRDGVGVFEDIRGRAGHR